MTLSQQIISTLKEKKMTLASAESITGGRIASEITSSTGSSKVFIGGVICYSEHSKIHSAGVDVRDIKKYGVYSEMVAKQMAERIMKRNVADIAISTTGCAEGECESAGIHIEKGEVIFGLARRDMDTQTFRKTFSGNREEVQQAATKFALEKILETISKK